MRPRFNPSPDVPELLLRPLSSLPAGRASSVLEARAQWISGGLTSAQADQQALRLTHRMGAKQLATRKRLQANPVSRAAERHERAIQTLLTTAVARAQATISVSALETALAKGDVPWHLLQPALTTLEDALSHG